MGNWVVGIDLGGTKIAFALVNPENQIIARRRIPTNADDGVEAVIQRIHDEIKILEESVPEGKAIAGIGICTPGPVDHITGDLLTLVNLPGISNTPFQRLLSEKMGVPVRLDHDAKVAALGEFYYGVGRGSQSMVYIVLGTGVGAAIIIDGKLYYGMSNTAGEVGHTTIDPNGMQCHCGSRGCLETYTSGPRIEQRYRERTGEAISGHEITERAKAGDPVAADIMHQAGWALGIAIATMAMILNIELYVLGSSVAKAGELLTVPARETVPQHSFKAVGERVKIETSTLGDDASLLGAAWIVRQVLED